MGVSPPDRRQFLLAGAAALAAQEKKRALGVVIHSYGVRSRVSRRRGEKPAFADPLTFLDHCRALGADGVQVGLGKKSRESLELAEPIAARAGVQLAVENHKDWRIDEFLDLLKRLSSKHVGVCVDTGNSVSLLEEPHAVVEAYAPFALTTHFKDMAVAECDDGFLLSEVPFGTGFLDLGKIVMVLRAKRPEIRFNVEMITRDPLRVPCLSARYWATLDRVSGRDLADALARVRKHAWKKPLPRLTGLSEEQQLRAEEENVVQSLAFARKRLGL
jgi:3-oxoisoapionate decarboxylase